MVYHEKTDDRATDYTGQRKKQQKTDLSLCMLPYMEVDQEIYAAEDQYTGSYQYPEEGQDSSEP
jgi:hypothetical protein